ncbi:MAG: hypothetical protein IT577_02030 [Verrucomicrobiae bacterium]|nr:hypothetical protein [Verrucomicrobiae bacterium]
MRGTVERILVVIGLLSALAGVVLIWVAGAKYDRQLRDLRAVQEELATVQKRTGTYQRLVDNLVAYSRVQPNVDALLVPFGFKQPAQAPAQPQAAQGPAPQPTAAPQTGGRK